ISRSAYRVGGYGHARGKRLEQNEAERIGEAREHEHIGRSVSLSELLAVLRSGKQCVGVEGRKLCGLRSAADQHLASGKVEVEKGLDVLLNGDAADVEGDRLRDVEANRPRPGQTRD